MSNRSQCQEYLELVELRAGMELGKFDDTIEVCTLDSLLEGIAMQTKGSENRRAIIALMNEVRFDGLELKSD